MNNLNTTINTNTNININTNSNNNTKTNSIDMTTNNNNTTLTTNSISTTTIDSKTNLTVINNSSLKTIVNNTNTNINNSTINNINTNNNTNSNNNTKTNSIDMTTKKGIDKPNDTLKDETKTIDFSSTRSNKSDESRFLQAWEILQNPSKVKDRVSLTTYLNKLGMTTAIELSFCEIQDILEISNYLKPIPSKLFLKLINQSNK